MNILITRPFPEGEELVKKLISIGKFAYHLPLIYFTPGATLSLIKKQLNFLSPGDFLFIISQHAAQYAHLQLLNMKTYWPAKIKYYAIGHKTSLTMYTLSGIKSKYPKNHATSENLLQLPELTYNISGRHALILKGNNGRTLIQDTLQKRGVSVLCCECYTRHPLLYNGTEQYERMLMLNITIIVVTTEEILKQLYYLIPKKYRETWLIQCQLIVVSTRLAKLARILGWTKIIITESANNYSIFMTLIQHT